MSFLDINSLVKFKNLKGKAKIGRVINNNDPEKKGRIKVSLQGMFDPQDEEGSNLPWIKRYGRSFKGVHEFSMPEVNSLVEIVWPFGSRIPMYKPAPYDSNNPEQPYDRQKEEDYDYLFINDYPNEWGWIDSNRFSFKINKRLNNFLIRTKKLKITGSTEGEFDIKNDNVDTNIKASGDIIIKNNKTTISISNAGIVSINSDNVTITSSTVMITGSSSVSIGSNTTIDNKVFLTHTHSNGHDGQPTGGVL